MVLTSASKPRSTRCLVCQLRLPRSAAVCFTQQAVVRTYARIARKAGKSAANVDLVVGLRRHERGQHNAMVSSYAPATCSNIPRADRHPFASLNIWNIWSVARWRSTKNPPQFLNFTASLLPCCVLCALSSPDSRILPARAAGTRDFLADPSKPKSDKRRTLLVPVLCLLSTLCHASLWSSRRYAKRYANRWVAVTQGFDVSSFDVSTFRVRSSRLPHEHIVTVDNERPHHDDGKRPQ